MHDYVISPMNCSNVTVDNINETLYDYQKECAKDTNITNLLNMAYICDRNTGHVFLFSVLYICVAVTAIVSNASVVLASIVERWKEIDQFTFVFAVSLSFNHFLVAFLVYPMGCYTMLKSDGWGLGKQWCVFTAYCSSYFEILYMLHVLMIAFDMVIYYTTKLKDVVKVFLCKKVAMSLWVTALIPHALLLFSPHWFLRDEGTLGVRPKYQKCVKNNDDEIVPKQINNCYVTYTFTTFTELNIYWVCFVLLPFTYVSCLYVVCLYLRKRSMFKNKHRIELCEDDELPTFIQRYKASLCMISVFAITQLPKWITSIVLLYKTSGKSPSGTVTDNYSLVLGMDFLSFWTCLGSILIPFCYMMTCPTYFHAVTETRVLRWMRKHGEFIHGRTYSRRYSPHCHNHQPPPVPYQPNLPVVSETSAEIEHLPSDRTNASLVIGNSNVKGLSNGIGETDQISDSPNHVGNGPNLNTSEPLQDSPNPESDYVSEPKKPPRPDKAKLSQTHSSSDSDLRLIQPKPVTTSSSAGPPKIKRTLPVPVPKSKTSVSEEDNTLNDVKNMSDSEV